MDIPTILAIESSCDDTSAALLRGDRILSNVIASQKVHEQYGGVVPELASRAHQQNIVPVVDAAIRNAGVAKQQIDAVAFTRGPGLLGSLMVGVSFAKSFAQALSIPLIEVNHLQAHVLSHFIKEQDDSRLPQFPFICLLVSGGHTQILLLRSHFDIEVLGQTIDDAAGEAIDKAAKIMDLGYPGGPVIDRPGRRPCFHRDPQSRPLCFHTEMHYRLPRQETGKSRQGDRCQAGGHCRRRIGQQPSAQRGATPRTAPPSAGLHPAVPVLHRQCRHGGYCRLLQISTAGLRRYLPAPLRTLTIC